MEKNHYILGFSRRRSGAFEHSWSLAKNLNKRGYETRFYSSWWDGIPLSVDILTEQTRPLEENELQNLNGILHLQTHTWEYRGFLDKILAGKKQTLIYGLHAIIPYFYLKEKDKIPFLEGKLESSQLNSLITNLSEREKAQLSAMEKSDYLFTISKNHKRVLELLNIKKTIHVFENVSDFYDLPREMIEKAEEDAIKLRESFRKEKVILYCGRIYPKKGANCLFESFKKIRKNYPPSQLILLGTKEKMKEEMMQYGLNENILDSVTFVPWIEKLDENSAKSMLKYFLASDVLIQPMITPELYSKSVIDAMTVGIPTISCKSPYTIGSSENAEAVFNSFIKIQENPEKVQEVVKRARQKVALENTWDSYISRLEKIVS
ncbi:glycosyltransferase family 4 protein [Candidatus Pacearchaeota archaeon]|nr:glycosyltransferase family 4 protein [Candidatus Pacearchaeota archaeon]